MGFPPTLIPTNKKKESENPKPEKKKKKNTEYISSYPTLFTKSTYQ